MRYKLRPILDISYPLSYKDLRKHDIIRVPQVIYQGMADIIHATGYDPAQKYKVVGYLQDWVEDTYPGKTVGASVELSFEEAKTLQEFVPGIEYGVYVKLIRRETCTHEEKLLY